MNPELRDQKTQLTLLGSYRLLFMRPHRSGSPSMHGGKIFSLGPGPSYIFRGVGIKAFNALRTDLTLAPAIPSRAGGSGFPLLSEDRVSPPVEAIGGRKQNSSEVNKKPASPRQGVLAGKEIAAGAFPFVAARKYTD